MLLLEEPAGHCPRGTGCLVEEAGVCSVHPEPHHRVDVLLAQTVVSTEEARELPESFLEEVSFENSTRDK